MNEKTKVLVVDDSGFVRAVVSKKLETDPGIEIVGTASDGIEAIEKVKELRPNVVTLDVMMPRMDGLAFLEHIMKDCPTPVVMLSACTSEGADISIKALELGAIDFFLKPSVLNPAGDDKTLWELIKKIKLAARAKITPRQPPRSDMDQQSQENEPGDARYADLKTIIIGTSTGGPRALMQVIPALPAHIPASILVVQHMPPLFTKSLAERLDDASQIEVREARAGDKIRPGLALIAPGDYHMVIVKGNRIALNQEPPIWGVRPSVDVTMESVAKIRGAKSVGVVLTGMGVDGTKGASFIKAAGGKILAEDESTCAVYGMPMSVAEAGYADKIVPVDKMAVEIMEMCQDRVKV